MSTLADHNAALAAEAGLLTGTAVRLREAGGIRWEVEFGDHAVADGLTSHEVRALLRALVRVARDAASTATGAERRGCANCGAALLAGEKVYCRTCAAVWPMSAEEAAS